MVCVGHVSAETGERIEMLFRGRLASAPGTMLTPPGEYDGHVLRQRAACRYHYCIERLVGSCL